MSEQELIRTLEAQLIFDKRAIEFSFKTSELAIKQIEWLTNEIDHLKEDLRIAKRDTERLRKKYEPSALI